MLDLAPPLWLQIIVAGGLGGVIRWWSLRANWHHGAGHILGGAIAGTYLGGLVFALLRPLADLSVIQPQDAQLLGAHIAGVVGINIYTIPTDFLKAWRLGKVNPPLEKETEQ